MMRVLLSIIIPHKNQPLKLQRLLESIPNNPEIEIIVVDDDSENNKHPQMIADKFPNVCFQDNPSIAKNAGTARNHGLDLAKGTWLMFADSDDCFLPGAFDVVLQEIQRADGIDVIFFKCTSVNEVDGTITNRHTGFNAHVDRYLSTGESVGLRYGWEPPWGKAIRAKVIEDNKIRFESLVASNDVAFSMLCGHFSGSVRAVDACIYCVTASSESLTGTTTPERALARLLAMTRRHLLLLQWDVNSPNIKLDYGVKMWRPPETGAGVGAPIVIPSVWASHEGGSDGGGSAGVLGR